MKPCIRITLYALVSTVVPLCTSAKERDRGQTQAAQHEAASSTAAKAKGAGAVDVTGLNSEQLAGTVIYYDRHDGVVVLRSTEAIHLVRINQKTQVVKEGKDVGAAALVPDLQVVADVRYDGMKVIGERIEILRMLPPELAPKSALPGKAGEPDAF